MGAVTEDEAGRVVFEYDPAFRRSGLEISPRNLPLTPHRASQLRRAPAQGVLSGAAWVTSRRSAGRLRASGHPGLLHSPWPGARGRCLPCSTSCTWASVPWAHSTFHPAEARQAGVRRRRGPGPRPPGSRRPRHRPRREAHRCRTGDLPHRLVGGRNAAQGRGAYTSPADGSVHSAFAPPRAGAVQAILKFDGVGPDAPPGEMGRPQPVQPGRGGVRPHGPRCGRAHGRAHHVGDGRRLLSPPHRPLRPRGRRRARWTPPPAHPGRAAPRGLQRAGR